MREKLSLSLIEHDAQMYALSTQLHTVFCRNMLNRRDLPQSAE
jgi:hypothetical protein